MPKNPKAKAKVKAKLPGVSSPSELSVQSSGMSATDFPFAGGQVMGRNQGEGGAGVSRQVRPLEHGWQYVSPPFNFRELRGLYDQNVWNKAAVDAIVDSVIGYEVGVKLAQHLEEAEDADGQDGDEAQKELAVSFVRTCGERFPIEDVLKSVQQDYENTGNGFIEVAREEGVPKYIYYIPSDTMRIHFDRSKYEQIRGGKRAFFFPFSPDNKDFSLNEIIHIHRPNPVSYYYGIPDHLAAIGSILADLRARDYNLDMFESNMIAKWAILFGGQVSAPTKRRIEEFFEQKLRKGDWHKPLIIGMDGSNLKVDEAIRFEKMSEDVKDMSFKLYKNMNRDEILACRRVPPSRVASLDTSKFQTSPEQAEQFRDEVVLPRQRRVEHPMNMLLQCLGVTDYEFELPVMDLTEETANATIATEMAQTQCFKRNEIRKVMRLDPLPSEEGGDEIIKPAAGAGKPGETNAPNAPVPGAGLSNTMQSLRPPGATPRPTAVMKSADEETNRVAAALERMERRIAKM